MVKILIKSGAKLHTKDNDGYTPLTLAIAQGHASVVKALVNAGVNPNAEDKDGWTPLHSAAWNGHSEVAEVLIKSGAGLTARDTNGLTPLDVARAGKQWGIVRLIENECGEGDLDSAARYR